MTKNFILFLCLAMQYSFAQSQEKFTSYGYVKEKGSKELMAEVPIYIPEIKNGTTTNPFGFYSITLPAMDSLTLLISYMGYSPAAKRFRLDKNILLDIDLEPSAKF